MYSDMLTDRTALDGLVYTAYLHLHKKVSKDTLDIVKAIYDKIIHEYDYIFYIPPEFNIVDDGVRSIDPNFRDEIVELFEGYISEMPREIVRLSGSVRERLDQIMKVIT
tara:strand:- start:152 stop:478 length:327 start_codon:yes stop_codon:yes gene_type:complete